MARSDKKPVKSLNQISPNDRRNESLPHGNAYKTNETVADAGNIEDYNGPLSQSDSPLLEKNVSADNLSAEKKR